MAGSELRYENELEDIMGILEQKPRRKNTEAQEAAIKLGRKITGSEFKVELTKMRNGAPDNDGVCLITVNTMSTECLHLLFETLLQVLIRDPESWSEEMKEVWV